VEEVEQLEMVLVVLQELVEDQEEVVGDMDQHQVQEEQEIVRL
jgi:hypothetical protein